MGFRIDVVEDEAGIKCDVERDVVTAAHRGWRRVGSDTRCIRNPIGIGSKAVALRSSGRRTGNVAWSNNHRKHKLVRAVNVVQSLDVADRDLYLLARKNVCD